MEILNIDFNNGKTITEITKWKRFLAIVGFIGLGIATLFGVL